MDTSETYIKMRRAAIPDLGYGVQMQTGLGVPLHMLGHNPKVYMDGKGDLYFEVDGEPYYCQLERQDQLQEMVSYAPEDIDPLSHQFADFVGEEQWRLQQVPSWEQLWLAFVKKEKYGKVWDGTDWSEQCALDPGLHRESEGG